MNAAIQSTIRQGMQAYVRFALGAGAAMFMILGTLPVIARTLQGGPQFAGIQIIIPAAIALAAATFAALGHARLRGARRKLAMSAGEHSSALLRLNRDIQTQQMWFLLIATFVLPIALLRQQYQPLPVGAVVTGAIVAAAALLQVLRQGSATEAYWSSLDAAELKAESQQAWKQRFAPLLVMVVLLPAYIYLLALGGDPISAWFALPPGRDQAINIVVTLYVLVFGAWVVVNYRLVQKWRQALER